MSDSKKDLTRIEDLSEYLHEDKDSSSDTSNDWQNEDDGPSLENFPPEFSRDKTDPAIEIPSEFYDNSNESDAFASHEPHESTFDDSSTSEEAPQEMMLEREIEIENDSASDFQPETPFSDNLEIQDEIIQDQSNEEKNDDNNEFNAELTSQEDNQIFENTSAFDNIEDNNEVTSTDIEDNASAENNFFEQNHTDSEKKYTNNQPQSQHNFQEVKDFAGSMALGNLAQEGTPPFSIIIKNLQYRDDINPIMDILEEFQVYKDEASKKRTKEALERGALLIPRLSEFVGILLCHKLRSFSLSLQMGLADEIHPSHLTIKSTGMASKASVFNVKEHHYEFQNTQLAPNDIQTATTSHLEGFEIIQYLGVIYENTTLNAEELEKEYLTDVYQSLTQLLKVRAYELKANAIVGINFNMTPIITNDTSSGTKYNLLCTGNAVWIKRA